MKELAIIKKQMIAIRSKRGAGAGRSGMADTGRRARFAPRPIREVLLQICCRCSQLKQSIQFMIVDSRSRSARPEADAAFSSPPAKSSTAKPAGAFGQAPLGRNPAPQPRPIAAPVALSCNAAQDRGGPTQADAGGNPDHGCHHNAYRF